MEENMKSVELWKLSILELENEWETGYFENLKFSLENPFETLKRNTDALKILHKYRFDRDISLLSFNVYHILNNFVDELSVPIYDDFENFSHKQCDQLTKDQYNILLNNLLNQHDIFELSKEQTLLFHCICARLKIRIPIRFRALEIFSKFLRRHSLEIVAVNLPEIKTNDIAYVEWREFLIGPLPQQLILWMSVSILLADKLENEYECLKTKDIQLLLCPLSAKYTSKCIYHAELFVLGKLKGHVYWRMPLDLIENLLTYCKLNPKQHQMVYLCCILVLKMAYTHSLALKSKYYATISSECTQASNAYSFGIWLSAGIVTSGLLTVISDNEDEIKDSAISAISTLTKIDISLILDLADFFKVEYLNQTE